MQAATTMSAQGPRLMWARATSMYTGLFEKQIIRPFLQEKNRKEIINVDPIKILLILRPQESLSLCSKIGKLLTKNDTQTNRWCHENRCVKRLSHL